MIFDTIQEFHGFENRSQHFFEPRISSPLKTTRAVDKIIVWGMYGGSQVLGTPKKSSGYGRARVEVTIATRIHQGTLLASARPHCRGSVPARVGAGLRLDVSPV